MMTLYLAPTSNGLGSLLMNLPALQALARAGRPAVLVLRSPAQAGLVERIRLSNMLAGSILESDFHKLDLAADDLFINLRDHPLQTDHVWGSDEFAQAFPDTYFEDMFEIICRDKGIHIDYERLQPISNVSCDATQGKVILVPGSNGRQKCWPVSYFVELAADLKNAGIESVVLGEPDKSDFVKGCIDAGLPWHETSSFAQAIDAISSAQAVVSVDTGLMHVAIHQGIPTVGLFRRANMILRQRAYTRYLKAPRCAQACIDAQFENVSNTKVVYNSNAGFSPEQFYWLRWECQESDGKRCMSQIYPQSVRESLQALRII